MSTASHNWSKVLMGEWSHPPCEGWRGNVAGGNGFSQFAETEGWGGGSLGATVVRTALSVYPHSASLFLTDLGRRDAHCVCLPVCRLAPARQRRLILILGLSSRDGSTLTLWLTADISSAKRFPGCEVESKSEARTSDSSETSPPL